MAKKKTTRISRKSTSAKKGSYLALPKDYPRLFSEIKERIDASRLRAHFLANQERTLLYWHIGQLIHQRQEEEGWGMAVIPRLAQDLKKNYSGQDGLSERNLGRMIRFAKEYSNASFLPQPVAKSSTSAKGKKALKKRTSSPIANLPQAVAKIDPKAKSSLAQDPFQLVLSLPWGHNFALIEKIKDPSIRFWYAAKTLENGWSRAVLVHQIEHEAHRHDENKANNFALTLPSPHSDLALELVKDRYNLSFLDIQENIRERQLEEKLILHLRDFLLELGVGFAFIGNQYPIQVGRKDYYMDLLFYHTRLHCYVVVDLKIDDFKPEYSGKMNFYLSAVDDLVGTERDSPSIGIILCKEKNDIIVEYALLNTNRPIAVAQYSLTKRLPAKLRGELPSVADLKKTLREDLD